MPESSEISSRALMKAEAFTKSRLCPSSRRVAALRIISAFAVTLAAGAAIIVVTLRLIHCFEPNLLPWTVKSAVPLIFAGVAFGSLQFALPRTCAQITLGLVVALAFILWGAEQYIPNHEIAAIIDDIVVFLFVFDLSIVTYRHLKPGVHPVGQELPFDGPAA